MEQTIGTSLTLDKIITTIGDLPASPAIMSTILGLTSDPDSRVAEISRVMSMDQSLTAKVLRLSNSSYYGRSRKVTTLNEAIQILGFQALRSMVITTSAHAIYLGEDPDGIRMRLWRHSLSSAVTARQIARHMNHPSAEEAFVAALLHDIGKLVLIQKLPGYYREIVHEVLEGVQTFLEVEQRALHFTHCDVASILLEHWSFPPGLVSAIHRHHSPPRVGNNAPPTVACLACLGNHLSKKMGVGFSDRQIENLAEAEFVAGLSLDEPTLGKILEDSREHYESEIAILK
ncbi:MAG: HDOD domain-containing protein [Candidatus Zixiibacteriota bacterium]|nr:MAG: HDOD domain-containing protein [candidate division Zixibacteria bacterium]